jgi:hypothetical protein
MTAFYSYMVRIPLTNPACSCFAWDVKHSLSCESKFFKRGTAKLHEHHIAFDPQHLQHLHPILGSGSCHSVVEDRWFGRWVVTPGIRLAGPKLKPEGRPFALAVTDKWIRTARDPCWFQLQPKPNGWTRTTKAQLWLRKIPARAARRDAAKPQSRPCLGCV